MTSKTEMHMQQRDEKKCFAFEYDTGGGGQFTGKGYRDGAACSGHDPFFFPRQSALLSLPIYHRCAAHAGGALNFFSGSGVRLGFPKCGACELIFASEKWGL